MSSELKTVQDELKKTNTELDSVKKLITPKKVKQFQDPALHEFPKKDLKIRVTKAEPYKDGLMFHISKSCWNDAPAEISSSVPFSLIGIWFGYYDENGNRFISTSSKEHIKTEGKYPEMLSFLERISQIAGVSKIDSDNSMALMLTKSGAVTWEEILPKVLEAIASNFPDVEKTQEGELLVSEKIENQSLEA